MSRLLYIQWIMYTVKASMIRDLLEISLRALPTVDNMEEEDNDSA